jgi:LysM repeat protein
MKNKNLVLFIGVGFIVTIAIWGFVGGCGTINDHLKTGPVKALPPDQEPLRAEPVPVKGEIVAEGPIFEKNPVVAMPKEEQKTSSKVESGKAVRQTYIVQQGDTLWKVSKKFNVSVQSIKDLNSLKSDNISIGQSLIMSGSGTVVETQKVQLPVTTKTHTEAKPSEVKQNEIKKTDVKDIKVQETTKTGMKEVNSVVPSPVQQQTKLQAKPGTVVYVVKKDDSLWRVAQAFGTTPDKIADLNGLSKTGQLTPGKEILVPSNE